MNKKELLAKVTSGFTDLYVDNKPTTQKVEEIKSISKEEIIETKKVNEPKEEKISKEVSNTPKKEIAKTETKKEVNRMISYRLPESLIEKVDKYAYVSRENKQDVIINALEKFFDSKTAKEILSQYDEIKK